METSEQVPVEITQRVKLVGAHPLFAILSQAEITEFARAMQEIPVATGQVIVKEGDLVDSIFFIVKGDATVSRRIVTNDKTVQLPLAILHSGDAIGVAEAGFYSVDGKRTATVRAKTNMLVLKMDLNALSKFFNKYSQIYPGLKRETEKLLYLQALTDVKT
jgi:CRP-like cAMP-binding protein